ncbi:MAG: squalene/phytoene synthase family protein, partial [Waterburya sp.]
MKFQIKRAREYYKKAEKGIRYLIRDSRLPVWASLMLYQGILKEIEANDYDVFNKRAFVAKHKKTLSLPIAWLRAQVL